VTDRPAASIIAIGSGKGGVGKSTVALQLALALARRGLRVGLLDADLYGPDVPLMIGITCEERARQWQLWRESGLRLAPIERHGIAVMSVGFLIGEGQALTMAAPLLAAALRQLTRDVDGGERVLLILDLPPGTADLQQQLLATVELDGAVVVVGPQDVAHLDARKFVDFLRSADVPIIGGVENMRGFVCPGCGERVDVFAAVSDERSIWAQGVRRLGVVPLDPRLGEEPAAPYEPFEPVAVALLAEIDERSAA
jgi:ATP-binding protein involved in chromosome partitioning